MARKTVNNNKTNIDKVPVIGGIPMARSLEIIARLRILKQRIHPAGLARRWVILSVLVSFITLTVTGGLSLVYAESNASKSVTRVLHFPKDRSLGKIKVLDANIKRQIQTSHYDAWNSVGWQDWRDWTRAEYFGEAQGDVVIPAGKKAALFLNKDAFKDLSPLLNLKPDDLYMLTHKPPWNTNISLADKCMQHIAHLTGLKDLRFYKIRTSTVGMKHITKLQSLEMLVPPQGLTNRGLSYVAQLKSLKRLYFTEYRVTYAGLKRHLHKLDNLEELWLGQGRISDAGLVFLADLPMLRYLSIRYGNFTDAGMAHVKKCSSLRILDLISVPITDAGVYHLSSLDKLENLNLYKTKVTNRGLAYLKSMPFLKKLNVGKLGKQDQITDAGMVHLAQINSLEHLTLPGGITDKGAAQIAKLKNLNHLSGGGDSDAALQHLSKLQSLEFLSIGGSDITDVGIEHLSKFTNLKDLRFSSDSITNEGLAKLKSLNSLNRLSLNGKKITVSGLSGLNTLSNLTKLEVGFIKQDNLGMDISGLTKLEELRLRLNGIRKGKELIYDKLRDEDLACLAKLKNLRLLTWEANWSAVTDTGIAYLKDLPNMRELYCGSPYLTDKSLSHLANMKTLISLTIHGNFTDDGLGYLEQLKALKYLKIYSANNFSPAAIRQLKEKLPNLSSFTAEQDRELKKMSKNNPNPSTTNTIAPPFAIKTLDGKDIKLKDYRGKVVVLYFWATWCSPCVAGTPELKKGYADMKASFGDDFEMISLSMDESEQSVGKHVKKYGLTWPQARIGLHSKISSDYGVNDAAPKSFLIGPDGKILLVPESPQVDTKSFIEDVLKNRKT